MKSLRFFSCIGLAGVMLFLTLGCASVNVQKLNTAGDNVVGPSGMRFYLPRPYVSVFEPFVVDSVPYLVAGRLTSDRQFVWISTVPEGLKEKFPTSLKAPGDNSVAVPAGEVYVVSDGKGGLQAGTGLPVEAAKAQAEKIASGAVGTTQPPTESKATPVKPQDKPGMLNLKSSNDNQSFAVTPTRRFFDILWLPDFEEQYVVQGKAGLGNAAITVQMGQGWSLQGLEAYADNSELVNRIYSLYDKSIDLLLKYGSMALGLPPIPTGGLQAGKLEDEITQGKVKAGEEITLKITVTRLVAPGLYPILKPSETAEMKNWETVKIADANKTMLLPKPPLNNIAFKTYEVLVVEAVKPVGDSPLNFATYKDVSPPPTQPSIPRTSEGRQLSPEKLKGIGDDLKGIGLENVLCVWRLDGVPGEREGF